MWVRLRDGVITNIMTVEHEGVGILGHVFTLPQEASGKVRVKV